MFVGSVVAGIFSWLDYRKKEVEVLDAAVAMGFRRPPNAQNWWRWYETYCLAFVIAVAGLICAFVESTVVPAIQ